jgi:drug/metabolite transporter (DMT)-like permease
MNRAAKSYLFALLAVLFWATVPTAFKICLADLSILNMLTIASLASTLVLFMILLATGKFSLLRMSTGKEIFSSAVLGLINPVIYYFILLRAYQLLPAQVAQPLNMIWPIILVFLSVPVLGQKIGIRSYIALFISFTGVFIISSQGHVFGAHHANLKGVLLALGSSVFWAAYFIFNMKDKREETVKLFMNFLFGSICLLLISAFSGKWFPELSSTKGILAAVYIGLFEMGVTFWLWLKALRMAETTDRISNLVYLAPFLSLILVHFILHEYVYYTTPAGLVLIITGILFQNTRRRKS